MMSKSKQPNYADHVRRKNALSPINEVIEERSKTLQSPTILDHYGYARLLGVRERILSVIRAGTPLGL